MVFLSLQLTKPPESFYLPGETIVGTLTVDVPDAPFNCDDLNLTIDGKAEVQIVERRSRSYQSGGTTRTEYYDESFEDTEIYFSSTIPFLKMTKLAKGRMVFPFEYTLPSSLLPCSYEAGNGSIWYAVAAHLKGPKGKDECEFHTSLQFKVGPFLDLNTSPRLKFFQQQTEFEEEKEYGKSCFASVSGIVKVVMVVPKRFLIPGEFIRFKVTTSNKSDTHLKDVVVQFVLTITSCAQGIYRGYDEVLGELKGPAVMSGCSQVWHGNYLCIFMKKPIGIPPTDFGGCNIISASYALRYSGTLEGASWCCGSSDRNFTLTVPILVGTVALNT